MFSRRGARGLSTSCESHPSSVITSHWSLKSTGDMDSRAFGRFEKSTPANWAIRPRSGLSSCFAVSYRFESAHTYTVPVNKIVLSVPMHTPVILPPNTYIYATSRLPLITEDDNELHLKEVDRIRMDCTTYDLH